MYNEIRRKITSLTLMTIMLAGGMTIASSGMEPVYAATNANLFVSAENSNFGNYMSGPQVIEVVIINSDINDTDEANGEPDVTVNGKDLRMVQAVDGNWYGYFADKKQALIADATAAAHPGQGLDFGGYCDANLVLNSDSGSGATATGTATGDVVVGTGIVAESPATGTVTLASVQGADFATGSLDMTNFIAAETVTVNGTTFIEGVTGGFAFNVDPIIMAASLVTEINALETGLTAANGGSAIVTITADDRGTVGNAIVFDTNSIAAVPVPATGFFDGGDDGDTFTVDTDIYTAILNGPVGAFEFQVGGTDANDAIALQAVIATPSVVASVGTNIVTLTAATSGVVGNSIALSSSDGVTLDVSGATLTGGASTPGDTLTVGANTYTATASPVLGALQFAVTGVAIPDAIALALAINLASTDVTATDDGAGTVTITAATSGVSGNTIALTSSNGVDLIVTPATGFLAGGSSLPGSGLAQSMIFTQTSGVYIPSTDGIAVDEDGDIAGTTTTASCGNVANGAGTNNVMNVVREAKDVNQNSLVATGQVGVDSSQWPFIQLYTLNPTGNVDVQYNPAGSAQSVELTFDTVDQFAKASLDQAKYTTDAQVHVTITDLWLNIDPTDEDSWTFGTASGNPSTNYQVFDENGNAPGDVSTNAGTTNVLTANLSNLMCENNCILLVDANVQGTGAVLTIQDNEDSQISLIAGNTNVDNAAFFETDGNNLQGEVPITITEQGPNSGVFGTYDESDTSVIRITSDAKRGTSASIDYNEKPVTVLVGFDDATIDIQVPDDEWNSGEEVPVVIIDGDANKNSRSDEDLDLFNPDVKLIPTLTTGDPFTIGEAGTESDTKAIIKYATGTVGSSILNANIVNATTIVDKFSERAVMNSTNLAATTTDLLVIDYRTTAEELKKSLLQNSTASNHGFNFLNIDVRSLNGSGTYDVYLTNTTTNLIDDVSGNVNAYETILLGTVSAQDLIFLSDGIIDEIINDLPDNNKIGLVIEDSVLSLPNSRDAIVADFFSYGFVNDGLEGSERIANQIIRIEAEESDDNTGNFVGSLEYKMVNQLNILDKKTYEDLSTIADDPEFIVIEDLTDEDSPRVTYLDKNKAGVAKQISAQEEAPSHSGVVSFDSDSYKTADTVVITLEDLDLNVDSDLIDIYTTVIFPGDANNDAVGSADTSHGGTSIPFVSGNQLGRLLDVTFDDNRWTSPADKSCTVSGGERSSSNLALEEVVTDTGLGITGFTLVETDTDSGIFTGSFEIPGQYCKNANIAATGGDEQAFEAVTGLDIEVNYVDFRDASGEIIEVGDSAGVRANTGSVSLDRTVYPVPFGVEDDFKGLLSTTPDNRAIFPIHQTGMNGDGIGDQTNAGLTAGEFLDTGDLTIHVRVNDADFDISASGEDVIATNSTEGVGPVKISVIRGSSEVVLGYAGGPSEKEGRIDVGDDNPTEARQFGPIVEIAPDAGIFELDVSIRYTDGPASTSCPDQTDTWEPLDGSPREPNSETNRFDDASGLGNFCILQGDILSVEYSDPADASGDVNTVTDSATFDLRNGVLQADKSVYIIGSDMILTLIEPDFDLDNDQAETYDLDLIEWDSDAATITIGDADGEGIKFDPEPSNFRETGDSTGIFQIVIEIPQELENDALERGEEIVLEYTDWGPSGSDFVGDEDEDVNLTLFTSNFGATIELDQKVYSWTDKVYITIVAPDHNFDGDLVDEIGNTEDDPIKVSTRGTDLEPYKLVETGTDTGIFTGEVILTGFEHDADGDSSTGLNGNDVIFRAPTGVGPTDGFLPADDDDGLTVSFEFSEDETVVGSALIRWNIGEVQWLEASYPASGTGVVRVIDPDMNLDPEAVDNFDVDIWSDSDAGGIDLTVTETNEATGIYEGTVFFTVTDESSGHRLRVAEGDTVTAEYEDNTLPDPYTTADELDITATSLIGTVVPPLERAPAANLRTVDAFGNSLDTVAIDQQVQISADLANGQDREQSFAYLVQIQDGNGVTVSLAWITGSLSAGQSFSPALSWIPEQAGTYTATAFVWESVDNPTALSPPVSTQVTVQ